jgi:hypothetical protein
MRDLASVHLIFWCVQSSRTRATRPTTDEGKNFFFKTENLKWSTGVGSLEGGKGRIPNREFDPRGPEAEGIRILHHPIHHDHTPYSQGTHPFFITVSLLGNAAPFPCRGLDSRAARQKVRRIWDGSAPSLAPYSCSRRKRRTDCDRHVEAGVAMCVVLGPPGCGYDVFQLLI